MDAPNGDKGYTLCHRCLHTGRGYSLAKGYYSTDFMSVEA